MCAFLRKMLRPFLIIASTETMEPTRITIHCTATRNGQDVPARTIKQWHLRRGWRDIGYHIVIQPSGQVEQGRPTNRQGAHVKDANQDNIGICMVGNDKFTNVQWQALRDHLRTLFLHYDIPEWALYGHRDFESARAQNKTCPNIETGRIWAWYFLGKEDAIKPHIFELSIR